ncbi:transketolase C-terminal domain-containing protein [uncultured Arcticibacterium sp.]|uniref:transketolase family protein n=1 Tax=uncultured Arcticibacterium sp. TaxID=2173042 RepID=UPI0030F7FED8
METVIANKKANQVVFSETLEALAEHDKDILIVTSDSRGSGKLVPFAQKYPDQVVEVGIAEQNLVGVAAGLASMGKKAFAVSPSCFLTARSLEQIKNDVCYSGNPVKLVGISAGISYGALGTTHHSLHDFAVLRAINNITIVAPADNLEAEALVRKAVEMDSPIYLRFGKKNMPENLKDDVLGNANEFEIGKGRVLREGADLTFIANGETVLPCKAAAQILSETHGINCKVVSMHTIKPLDAALIFEIAEAGQPIITAEEHSIYGGLGESVASLLMQNGFSNPFRIVGLPDDHTVSGSQVEIFDHYGISAKGLTETALDLIKK